MIQAAYWYLRSNQFRHDHFGADTLVQAAPGGQLAGKTTADIIAQSARMGWMSSYPTFDRNPQGLTDEAEATGRPVDAPERRTQMKVMAQMSMVMNLDKRIGCHTCSVTCKKAWTHRSGTGYVFLGTVIVLGMVNTVFANVFSDYDNRGGDCPVPLSPTSQTISRK